MNCFARRAGIFGLAALATLGFGDSLRIATWNTSLFDGTDTTQNAGIQSALFSSFQGRSFRPDVLFAQEIQSPTAANTFKNLLNTAAGSTGDWNVTFGSLTGTSSTSDTAMFYRTSKVGTVSANLVLAAGGTTANPRDAWRFDFSIVGNAVTTERFGVYNSHMKSGDSATDQNRRQIEAAAIRSNANGLASNYQIVSLGDFNGQSSSQSFYQTLTGSAANNRGRFFDPIGTPGSWNGNNAFRFVHTQDPTGAGGMDDRHDQILMGAGLGDGVGTDYTGVWQQAYSTTTWNDLNHSYRVWGNDGTSFNSSLTVGGNAMVGSTIAQALKDAATPAGGHLPVFADIRYDAVPEPASMAVLGGLALVALRRRKKN
ncbi:MAG: PEP-CTERM sorting domain-containing protein [Fimbriimonadaceae bacterium]